MNVEMVNVKKNEFIKFFYGSPDAIAYQIDVFVHEHFVDVIETTHYNFLDMSVILYRKMGETVCQALSVLKLASYSHVVLQLKTVGGIMPLGGGRPEKIIKKFGEYRIAESRIEDSILYLIVYKEKEDWE